MSRLYTSFQFSLRELMLAITATAAMLCLIVQNISRSVPFSGTGLTSEFSLDARVNQIARDRGLSMRSWKTSDVSSSLGPDGRHDSCSIGFQLPKTDREPVFNKLAWEIEAMLSQANCEIRSYAPGSRSYHWRYRTNSFNGSVRIEMHDDANDPNYAVISYFVVEFEK